MRPIYERPTDRVLQRRCIEAFCAAFGCESRETPPLAGWDYELTARGRLVAVAEVKVRSNPMGAYRTYLISERKVASLIRHADARGVSPLLIVAWKDAMAWTRLASGSYEVSLGGRTDRNDPADIESVALIAIDRFRCF